MPLRELDGGMLGVERDGHGLTVSSAGKAIGDK
jgi:hypothetical protein